MFTFLFSSSVFGVSNIVCPVGDNVVWDNCVGKFTHSNGDEYIGETGKAFRGRIRTHFLAVKNHNRTTALGVHYLESHPEVDRPEQDWREDKGRAVL